MTQDAEAETSFTTPAAMTQDAEAETSLTAKTAITQDAQAETSLTAKTAITQNPQAESISQYQLFVAEEMIRERILLCRTSGSAMSAATFVSVATAPIII